MQDISILAAAAGKPQMRPVTMEAFFFCQVFVETIKSKNESSLANLSAGCLSPSLFCGITVSWTFNAHGATDASQSYRCITLV